MANINHVKSVWIYGKGSFSGEIQRLLSGKSIQVLGVIDSEDLKKHSLIAEVRSANSSICPVVIAVFNHLDDPITIANDLVALGLRHLVSPAELFLSFPREDFGKYFLTSKAVGIHAFETENFFDFEIGRQALAECAQRVS